MDFDDRDSTENAIHMLWVYVGIQNDLSTLLYLSPVFTFFSVLVVSIKAPQKLLEEFRNLSLTRFLNCSKGFRRDIFSIDLQTISRTDRSMVDGFGFFNNQVLQLPAKLLASALVSLLNIIVAGVVFLIYANIAWLYLARARGVKGIVSMRRSPIFEQLGSTMAGLATIRPYGMNDIYISE